MSEFDRIAKLRALFGGEHARIPIGIGDDAAVIDPHANAQLVVSVDSSVEGTHFRRQFASLEQIAARAVTAATSDLAAMGAAPLAAFVSLVAPQSMSDAEFEQIARGVQQSSTRYALPVAGGNLSRGGELSITTTVLGETSRPLTRSGARVGDEVFVSGTLGLAHLGLCALLKQVRTPDVQPWIDAWRNPRAMLELGVRLAGVATACIDLSDGLVQDAGHVAQMSNVGIELDTNAVPQASVNEATAHALGTDGVHAALRGGEDYALLFTMPADAPTLPGATRIGRVTSGNGVTLLRNGEPFVIDAHGHDHFSR